MLAKLGKGRARLSITRNAAFLLGLAACGLMVLAVPFIATGDDTQTLTGEIVLDHADNFSGHSAEYTMLDTGTERLALEGASRYRVPAGAHVKVRGHRHGSTFALSWDADALTVATGTGSVSATGTTTTAATTSTMNKRVAVLLLNFVRPTPTPTPTPTASPPATPGPTNPVPSASASISASSSPASSPVPTPSLQGTPPPSPSPSPSPTPTPPLEPWTKQQAADLYFTSARSVATYYSELSNGRMSVTGDVFGYFTVNVSTTSCDYATWGAAARAAATAAGIDLTQYTNVVHAFPKQAACWWSGLANVPGRNTWINGDMTLYVASHELGHNWGVDHAASLTCTSGGVRVAYSSNCTADEYGDPFDPMGHTGQRHMSNWHRWQIGFLSDADVRTVTAHGTYRVAPAEVQDGVPRVLRVARPSGDFYYLEFRQPYGIFDNFLSTSTAVNGVMIRVAPGSAIVRSKLIDNRPDTATFSDATLTVGRTFYDPVNTIYVTVLAVSAAGADVSVQVGPDVVPPGAPTNLLGATDATGGLSLSWTASTDDVIVTSYEVLRDGVPVGSVAGTSFAETSLPQAVTYTYSVRAHDRSNTSSTATKSVYLPDTTAPTLPGSLRAAQTGAHAVSLTWAASTDNLGVAAYRVTRDGISLGAISQTTFADTSAPDGWTSRYGVRAVDAAGNEGPTAVVDVALPDVTAPILTGTLSATFDRASPSLVSLAWPAAIDNVIVTGYTITRNGVWLADASSAAWNDESVSPAQSYGYSVVALDAAGNRSTVVEATIYVPDMSPPGAPATLAAQLTDAHHAALSWGTASDNVGVDHYVITANGSVVASNATLGPNTVVVVDGRTYRFAIYAVDAAGNAGAETATSLAVPDVTAPSAVPSIVVKAVSATSAAITWGTASDNVAVSGYIVSRSGTVVASLPADARSYADGSLVTDRTYSYSVAARDAAGNVGPLSSASAALTSVDTTPPSVPTNLRGVAIGSRRVSLTWSPSVDNRTGIIRYKIFRGTTRIATVTTTAYVDRPAAVGTYRYRVRAVDAAGNHSAFSISIYVYAARAI